MKKKLLNNKFFFLLSMSLVWLPMLSQETLPVNSNLLIENGISPKVLDAALSATLQEGSFKEKLNISRKEGDSIKEMNAVFIYDPAYKEGIDIQIGFNKGENDLYKRKDILKYMQEMHTFSRNSKSYLYNENSLKVISATDDEIILSFVYDKTKLEPEMNFAKKLQGKIFIKNNELVKVELTNTKKVKILKHKIEAGNFISTTYFKRAKNIGGHIVSNSIKYMTYQHKGNRVESTINSETFEYKNSDGIATSWSDMQDNVDTSNLDIIDKNLGSVLPIFGKGARKLGYKLPRAIGVNVFMHFQSQTLKLNDIQVGFNGGELRDVSSLVNFDASSVPQSSQVESFRADVWVFPFLNISAMVGKGQNRLDGQIFLSDELKDALQKYGWLIGIDKDDVPDYFPIRSELTSVTYGGGATLGGGVGNFNLSLTYQIVWAKVLEVNTNKFAQVINPAVGYRFPASGVNIMAGAQGQFYNTLTAGSIKLPNPNGNNNSLDFAVNFKPINWNFIAGVYAPVSDHFDISIQTGWGARRSLTAILGYRF